MAIRMFGNGADTTQKGEAPEPNMHRLGSSKWPVDRGTCSRSPRTLLEHLSVTSVFSLCQAFIHSLTDSVETRVCKTDNPKTPNPPERPPTPDYDLASPCN